MRAVQIPALVAQSCHLWSHWSLPCLPSPKAVVAGTLQADLVRPGWASTTALLMALQFLKAFSQKQSSQTTCPEGLLRYTEPDLQSRKEHKWHLRSLFDVPCLYYTPYFTTGQFNFTPRDQTKFCAVEIAKADFPQAPPHLPVFLFYSKITDCERTTSPWYLNRPCEGRSCTWKEAEHQWRRRRLKRSSGGGGRRRSKFRRRKEEKGLHCPHTHSIARRKHVLH